MVQLNDRCSICRNGSMRSLGAIRGFRGETRYNILECEKCGTCQAVSNGNESFEIYDQIYRSCYAISGYRRYWYYYNLARISPKLSFACMTIIEPCIWALRRKLEEMIQLNCPTLSVLEVGSGLGYSVECIRKSLKLDVIGTDISKIALAQSNKNFGPYFLHPSELVKGSFDVVYSTEVIEHLENPLEFLLQLKEYVGDKGVILISTPNRDHNKDCRWLTTEPPVHRWWFSKLGLIEMAKQAGLSVEFTIFSEFNALRQVGKKIKSNKATMNSLKELPGCVLREDGSVNNDYFDNGIRHIPRELVRYVKSCVLRKTRRKHLRIDSSGFNTECETIFATLKVMPLN